MRDRYVANTPVNYDRNGRPLVIPPLVPPIFNWKLAYAYGWREREYLAKANRVFKAE